jgi:hypothetical protein
MSLIDLEKSNKFTTFVKLKEKQQHILKQLIILQPVCENRLFFWLTLCFTITTGGSKMPPTILK